MREREVWGRERMSVFKVAFSRSGEEGVRWGEVSDQAREKGCAV